VAEHFNTAHWLHGLLLVLDDEELIVLHRPTGRGYRVTMSGIGDNFQLHILLAATLTGDESRGMIPLRRRRRLRSRQHPMARSPRLAASRGISTSLTLAAGGSGTKAGQLTSRCLSEPGSSSSTRWLSAVKRPSR